MRFFSKLEHSLLQSKEQNTVKTNFCTHAHIHARMRVHMRTHTHTHTCTEIVNIIFKYIMPPKVGHVNDHAYSVHVKVQWMTQTLMH